MRILNVGSNYRIAHGADRYFFSLQALLQNRGHEVIPLAAAHPDNRDTPWAKYFPPGLDPDAPRPLGVLRFVHSRPARAAMERMLAEAAPDLVHLHVYYGQLSSSILRPLADAGVPVVHTLHDYKPGCPVRSFVSNGEICEACCGRAFWHALTRRCNRGSLARSAVTMTEAYVARWSGDVDHIDHFLAVSGFLQDKMLEHDVIPASRISVLHNFVDPGAFRPSDRPGNHLLYYGRLAPEKGVRTLLRAAAPLRELPLIVAGSGPSRAALEAWASTKGWDHIRFVGFQEGDALHDLIRSAICVVVPSEWYENCPMTVLEAMALGRAVVASDIGGIPELVGHDETGFLFPAGNPEALRERLAWLAARPNDAVTMGQRGRIRVETEFGPSTHYERLIRIYGALMETGLRPAAPSFPTGS